MRDLVVYEGILSVFSITIFIPFSLQIFSAFLKLLTNIIESIHKQIFYELFFVRIYAVKFFPDGDFNILLNALAEPPLFAETSADARAYRQAP